MASSAAALLQMQLAQAEADAAQARGQLLIGYGDPYLARSLLGPQLGAAAGANPFSTLANLDFQSTFEKDQLEEALSRNNLWYSSARADQLTNLGRAQLGRKAEAAGQVQSSLFDIARQLRDRQMDFQIQLAQEAAANRGQGGLGMGNFNIAPQRLPRELYPELFQTPYTGRQIPGTNQRIR